MIYRVRTVEKIEMSTGPNGMLPLNGAPVFEQNSVLKFGVMTGETLLGL
jgi:hypothetical protein